MDEPSKIYETVTLEDLGWYEAAQRAMEYAAEREKVDYFRVVSITVLFDQEESTWIASITGQVPPKE